MATMERSVNTWNPCLKTLNRGLLELQVALIASFYRVLLPAKLRLARLIEIWKNNAVH